MFIDLVSFFAGYSKPEAVYQPEAYPRKTTFNLVLWRKTCTLDLWIYCVAGERK